MKPGRFYFWLFLFILPLGRNITLLAQDEWIKFENYSKDHGLLHSQILSICQDRQGFIWIGSYGGLNRFDGTNFTGFSTENSDLPTNIILSLQETKYGDVNSLWLGTARGLAKFNKDSSSFTYYDESSTRISRIREDEEGNLWLCSPDKGLLKFDTRLGQYIQTSLSYDSQVDRPGSPVNSMIYEQPGILWLGSDYGELIRYNCKSDSYEIMFASQADRSPVLPYKITCLYNLGYELLIGTRGGGLFVFDKHTRSLESLSPVMDDAEGIHPTITSISDDHEGNIWVSSFGGGLYRIEGFDAILKGRADYNIRNFRVGDEGPFAICSNMLNLIYKDLAGNLWIGSEGGGLSKLDFFRHKIGHYMIKLPGGKRAGDNNISAVFEDPEGNIWFGVRNNGIYVYNSMEKAYKHLLPFREQPSDPRNSVHDIFSDPQGRIWVSTDHGIFMFRDASGPRKYIPLQEPYIGPQSRNTFVSIAMDRNEALWLTNGENRLYRIDREDLEKRGHEKRRILDYTARLYDLNQNPASRIWEVMQDSEGTIWVSTSIGLYRYDYARDNFENMFATGVNSAFEPKTGSGDYFWLGTYGSGAFLFNKTDQSAVNFNVSNGLNHNNVSSIVEDLQGNIWISTAKGISSIYTKGLYSPESMRMGNISTVERIRNYWKSDGLQAHEFNIHAATRLSTNQLVFGGPNGFNRFDPLTIEQNIYVFPVIITDFKIFNTSIRDDTTLLTGPVEYLEEIRLNHRQNYFSIDFSDICFNSPQKAKYQYMLEGFDHAWVTTDAMHTSAIYAKIRPGQYIFKVKAANADGFWNEDPTILKISVAPPVWETLEMKISGMILLVFLSAFLVYRQRKMIAGKKRLVLQSQKERYEKERLESDLELRDRELASQTMYIVKKNEKLMEVRDMMKELKDHIRTDNKPRFLEILTSIDNDVKNQENWESFELNFNLIHNNFITRLIERYPELTHNDVKICSYMRMNLSSKEIANLLSITPKSLETNRVRIRRRMNLDSSVYLSNFIMRF